MSSFIGHSLAGLTVYGMQPSSDSPKQSLGPKLAWLLWFVFLANVLDIDYLIPALRPEIDGHSLRMTHSLAGALLLPGLTVLVMAWQRSKSGESQRYRFLLLAGLSHLGLDLMTGVSTLPLLYPLSPVQVKLPFGLLPSAGRIQLDNYFLYRNLFIELGVLIPLCLALWALWRPKLPQRGLIISACGLVSGLFMVWAASLSR